VVVVVVIFPGRGVRRATSDKEELAAHPRSAVLEELTAPLPTRDRSLSGPSLPGRDGEVAGPPQGS
jgi:hypothetical protein